MEKVQTNGVEFNALKRSLNGYEITIAMGGFIGDEVKRSADGDIRMLIREISDKFAGLGASRQVLMTGANSIVTDMLNEYVPEEDGGLFDYLTAFICESMTASVEESKEDVFHTIESDDAFKLLPSLEKKLLRMSKDANGKRISSEDIARDLDYLRPQLVLKCLMVAERNYVLNEDILSRAGAEQEEF